MDYEDIKKLIQDMGDSKLDSLDIEFPEGVKISMKKNEKQVVCMDKPFVVENADKIVDDNSVIECKCETFKVVKSPMVGTFYASPSPKEAPFVKVGDKVKKGDVLCVVEAMKLMNEVESEYDGEIAEICVQNEEVVEYGKPLFKIR